MLGALFLEIRGQKSDRVVFCNREYGLGPDAKTLEQFKEFQKNCFYSALLLPFYPYEYPIKTKSKQEKVIMKVMAESLKKSNDVVKLVMGTVPYVDKTVEMADRLKNLNHLGELKLEVGLFLREAGHKWDSIYLLAISKEYYNSEYSQKVE